MITLTMDENHAIDQLAKPFEGALF